MLKEFVAWLDDFSRRRLNEIIKNNAPNTNEFSELLSQFLGLPDGSPVRQRTRADIEQRVPALRNRVSKLLSTLEAFSREFSETFAPAKIEELVPPGGFMDKPRPTRCWQRYEELCKGRGAEHLLQTIVDLYAQIINEM